MKYQICVTDTNYYLSMFFTLAANIMSAHASISGDGINGTVKLTPMEDNSSIMVEIDIKGLNGV